MNAAKIRLAAFAFCLILAPAGANAMPLAAAKDMLRGEGRTMLVLSPAPAQQSILPIWLEEARLTLRSMLFAL